MPQLFFIFVGFIYAYFFSGSILKVLKLLPDSYTSYLFYAFAAIFVLYKNVEGINTVRTWTGMWILFYGAINYFETKKLKYLLLCFVPPLIHLGYFIMAVPAWIVLVLGNRFKWLFIIIYCISFFTSLPQSRILAASEENEVIEGRVSGYYVEDPDQFKERKFNDNTAIYQRYRKMGVQRIGIQILIFSFILGGVYFGGMNKVESGLFSIGIMTLALSNWTTFLFALNSRSGLIGIVFVLASIVLLLKRGYFHFSPNRFNNFQQIALFVSILLFIPFVLTQISNLLFFSSMFIIALPFVPWVLDVNISMREFLGYFIG